MIRIPMNQCSFFLFQVTGPEFYILTYLRFRWHFPWQNEHLCILDHHTTWQTSFSHFCKVDNAMDRKSTNGIWKYQIIIPCWKWNIFGLTLCYRFSASCHILQNSWFPSFSLLPVKHRFLGKLGKDSFGLRAKPCTVPNQLCLTNR